MKGKRRAQFAMRVLDRHEVDGIAEEIEARATRDRKRSNLDAGIQDALAEVSARRQPQRADRRGNRRLVLIAGDVTDIVDQRQAFGVSARMALAPRWK